MSQFWSTEHKVKTKAIKFYLLSVALSNSRDGVKISFDDSNYFVPPSSTWIIHVSDILDLPKPRMAYPDNRNLCQEWVGWHWRRRIALSVNPETFRFWILLRLVERVVLHAIPLLS